MQHWYPKLWHLLDTEADRVKKANSTKSTFRLLFCKSILRNFLTRNVKLLSNLKRKWYRKINLCPFLQEMLVQCRLLQDISIKVWFCRISPERFSVCLCLKIYHLVRKKLLPSWFILLLVLQLNVIWLLKVCKAGKPNISTFP